jgi:toxin-antitoxin system PIN domain toxin
MTIIDANLLLYAYDTTASHHAAARAWVERVFSSGLPVGIPWQSVSAFLRITTNPRLPGERFTPEEASEVVDRWLQQPNIRVLSPGEDHWLLLRSSTEVSCTRPIAISPVFRGSAGRTR